MNSDKTTHWQSVYQSKEVNDVSWFKPHLDVSLALLRQAGLKPTSRVIDIGAGASTLVDDLLHLGVQHVTALDLSIAALDTAKRRLGDRAVQVEWIVGDVAKHEFAFDSIDLWHDRAALHFIVDPSDAAAYVIGATRAIAVGGYAIIGGFASDGPAQCSGLPVIRREPQDIAELFSPTFALVDSRHEVHATPRGAPQSFAYVLLRKTS